MMSVTHAAIALATTSIAIGTANPWVLFVAGVGSQLPDIDTSASFTGRIFYPLARWLEDRYPHRTITHCFWASAAIAGIGIPLLWMGWQYWVALIIGYTMGWFSDAFTKAGVTAFYPDMRRFVIPGNPRARLESKSPAEYWVLAISVGLLVISTNLISQGGITDQFSRIFFADVGTAADTFRKHGSDRVLSVEVQGLNVATSQRVTGIFTVLEATTTQELIAESGDGKLYKIGGSADAQIRPTSIKAHLGSPLSIRSQEQRVAEIALTDWVDRLPAHAYISGSLSLEDWEDLKPLTSLESFQPIRLSSGQVRLDLARPPQIKSVLGGSWIVSGSVVVKERV